jgi:hypothetical protein
MMAQYEAIISSNGRSKVTVAQVMDHPLVPRIKGSPTLFIVRIPSRKIDGQPMARKACERVVSKVNERLFAKYTTYTHIC